MIIVKELKELVEAGGGINIDAKQYSTADLKTLATLANKSGASMLLRNADAKPFFDLKEIARCAPARIIFIFQ